MKNYHCFNSLLFRPYGMSPVSKLISSHLLRVFLLVALMVSYNTAWCGKIISPWRSTTAVVKQGGTFEVWFDADVGQTVSSVQLKSQYLTVNATKISTTGTWEYDFMSKNTYNTKLTVTVPANTPADRYELILNTSTGVESSTGAVKVIQDYKNEYYIAGTSCAHRWQSMDANGDGVVNTSSSDINVNDGYFILRKMSEIIKIAEIMDVELFFEAGDNMYSVRNNPDRETSYFHGLPQYGILGMHDLSSATFMTSGNHEAPDNVADTETSFELADFYNTYYGLYAHNIAYGNARYCSAADGWGAANNLSGQATRANTWLNSVGRGNLIVAIMHIKDGSEFQNVVAQDITLCGHNHFIANENPHMLGTTPQYVADSVRDPGNFEFNLFKINNSTGVFTTPSGIDARCQVVQSDTQAVITNPAQWIPNLRLTFASNNNGSANSNVATITNNYHFAIENAKIRFVMPLGNTYAVSEGTIKQAFNGTSVQVVDVAITVPANSVKTVNISLATAVPNNSQFISQTVPTSMNQGQTTSVSITMKNTGTDTWSTSAGHKLSTQTPANNTLWTGNNRVQLTQSVAPNANCTFTFNITAPNTPGLYDFAWQMVDDLSPNQGLFGNPTANVKIQVGPAPIHIESENFAVNSGFQTQATTDTGGGQNIAYTDIGDFVQYNVNIPQAGQYGAIFRVASASNGAKFELKNGSSVLLSVNEPATGGAQTWVTTSSKLVSLPAGNLTLTILATGSSWNMNWFELQLLGTNLPPQITSTPSTYGEVGTPYAYTIAASDSNNDPLTFSAITLPTWLSFNQSTKVLSGTPALNNIGSNTVTLRVTDGTSNVDQTFNITVSAAGNDAPVITSTPNTGAIVSQAYNYVMTATDADGNLLTYSAPTGPTWLTFNPITKTLSGTPTSSNIGMNLVNVAVTDGTATTTQSFNVAVFAAASNPNLVLNGSFESGTTTPSSWTTGNAAVRATDQFKAGTYSLKVTNNSSATSQTIALTANTDYVISAWILASSVTASSLVFDTSDKFDDATQIPGGTAQFLGNATSAPVWKKFSGAFNSSTLTSVTLRIFGNTTMVGTAYIDDIVLTRATAINTAPVFTSIPITSVNQNTLYSYTALAADAEGNNLAFDTISIPSWLNFDLKTGVLSGTPTSPSATPYVVSISVTDDLLTTTQTFNITVNSPIDNASDNDNDGIPYLLEVALGGNPNVSDADSKLPRITRNANSFDMSFTRASASITYTIQKSNDLVNWSDYLVVTNTQGTVGNTATISVPSTEMINGKLFLRLKVND
jgi:hypothetical protein